MRTPNPSFARARLTTRVIGKGERFGRIYASRHVDPLGFGKSPSRFSDPRRRAESRRFGVLYLGASLKVCFLEAFLRDRRNGVVGDYVIDERELFQLRFAEIELIDPLTLVDLRGDGAVRMGVPSDVARSSRQGLARRWSIAFNTHPSAPDGIVYPSRLNEETNVAIYDRAIGALSVIRSVPLVHAPGLASVLDELEVALA